MGKATGTFELTLGEREEHQTLTDWLYAQLRAAILEGRLTPGARLPASRAFAEQHGLSRGTVVSVLERLQVEGYVSSRVGSGTSVNHVQANGSPRAQKGAAPAYVRRVVEGHVRPKPWTDLTLLPGVQPFCMREPAIREFPAELWGRIAGRRARAFRPFLSTPDDGRGYRPLREALVHYLGASRGVRCSPHQILIVSGIQQALDLLSRVLLKPGEGIWVEDPGYFGATIAFDNAGARVAPVPVDEQGLSVCAGRKLFRHAKGAYVTPAHQFPLGMTMTLARRMELLEWAAQTGAFIIEDDYDSEYRLEGKPVAALQSLDRNSNVIFTGSFNKLLFPGLRIGYIVLPESLVDCVLAYRFRTDFRNTCFDQAVLCDFVADGHLGRHLRRMRELYGGRLEALMAGGERYLKGLLTISGVRAGLYTAAFLKSRKTSSRQAEKAVAAKGVEVIGLDRYCTECPDPRGMLLGFAAFDKREIRAGLAKLASALEG